jgi:Ubiquitin-2 like Rad60 SUMO-like
MTKKSFFKRPTWATNAPPTESGDFFRHSDIVYDSILREKEKRREKNASKKQAKIGSEAVEEEREIKRRKISTDEEGLEEDTRSGSDGASIGSCKEETREPEIQVSVSRSPTRQQCTSPGRTGPLDAKLAFSSSTTKEPQPVKINSGNDDDDDDDRCQPDMIDRKVPVRVSDDEVSEEEDEYVLALKQKAREKVRLNKPGIDAASWGRQVLPIPEAQQRPSPSFGARSTFGELRGLSTPPSKPEQTIVQILITTNIPNAKPLMVNRKVSQPMQQVRAVWCARQNFDEAMSAKVIFTWRGKKLYDTTTSTHLLDVLKKEHARLTGGLADDDEEDPSNGRIEVEAITKDMYEQRMNRTDTDSDLNGIVEPDLQDQESVEESTTLKEPEYRVVMNAQGLEALHLKVRPSTPIAKMMAAFKKMQKVDLDKTCWLVHDGDRLEPGTTVGDTEIEDGDAVEVHVR